MSIAAARRKTSWPDPGRPSARLLHPGHQGVRPDERHRQGPLGRSDRQADRRLAPAPAHRLCRPLPVPPLRPRDAAGRDHGGAHQGRASRARPATSASANGRRPRCEAALRPARRREVRLQPAAVLRCCGAGAGGKGDPALGRQRRVPRSCGRRWPRACCRASTGPARGVPQGMRAASDSMGCSMQSWLQEDILAAVAKLETLAEEAGCSPSQFSLAPCSASPTSPRPSSGPAALSRSRRTRRASGLFVDPELFKQAEALGGERPPRGLGQRLALQGCRW